MRRRRWRPPSSALKESAEAVARYLQNGGVIVAEVSGTFVGAPRTRDAAIGE